MSNLKCLERMKKSDNTSNYPDKTESTWVLYRSTKALEIIAEELCKMNNQKYEVTIAKPIRVQDLARK